MPDCDSNDAAAQQSSLGSTQGELNSNQSSLYNDKLKQYFYQIINPLELDASKKEFLTVRWLEQVLWMENKIVTCQNRHTWLRITTMVGGLMTLILVTLSLYSPHSYRALFYISTVFVSGVVAASSAIEGFFSYGRQWYGYRQSVESLKSQGWQFFQLTGPYQGRTHQDSFSFFAAQVEELIQRDVALYATQLSQQQQQQQQQLEQRLEQTLQSLQPQAKEQ